MIKKGVIEPGVTPPEDDEKQASSLEDHVCRRAADCCKQECEKQETPANPR